MRIQPPITAGLPSLTLRTPVPDAEAWRTGQVLEAVVTARSEDGRVTLLIGGRTVPAESPTPLNPGQHLRLTVERCENQQILLRLTVPAVEQETLQRGLRNALPRQAPLLPLVEGLARLVGEDGPTELPQSAAALARRILDGMPTPQQLASVEGLERALLDSGLFLENRLRQGHTETLSRDLKGSLLRLLAGLRGGTGAKPTGETSPNAGPRQATASPLPTPNGGDQSPLRSGLQRVIDVLRLPAGANPPSPHAAVDRNQANAPSNRDEPAGQYLLGEKGLTLLKQTEAALARIQFQQLSALPRQDSEEPMWLLELPVRHQQGQDVLTLQIRREDGRKKGDNHPAWSVTLGLEDERHGSIRIVVSLAGEQISVTFWAERETTAELFRGQLHTLHERLSETGLEVGRLASREGLPPHAGDQPPPLTGLLNEKA